MVGFVLPAHRKSRRRKFQSPQSGGRGVLDFHHSGCIGCISFHLYRSFPRALSLTHRWILVVRHQNLCHDLWVVHIFWLRPSKVIKTMFIRCQNQSLCVEENIRWFTLEIGFVYVFPWIRSVQMIKATAGHLNLLTSCCVNRILLRWTIYCCLLLVNFFRGFKF